VEDASFVDTERSADASWHEAVVGGVPQIKVRPRGHVGVAKGKVHYPCEAMEVGVWWNGWEYLENGYIVRGRGDE